MEIFRTAVLICGIFVVVQSCPSKFKSSLEEEYTNATVHCIAKLNLASTDLPSLEDMNHNTEIDDKCLTKCVYEKFETIGKDGLLERDSFFDYLEENAPKSLLSKLTESVNKCADQTGIDKIENPKDDMSTTAVTPIELPCKVYHDFHVCFIVNAEKLC